MSRIAYLLVAAMLIGCGSESTAPQNSFAGTWVGATHGLNFTIVATQSGNEIVGTGMWIADSGGELDFTVSGEAAPLRFTMDSGSSSSQPISYVGTFVTADSVDGTIDNGAGSTASLSLKKQ
jgi:hypothetical protein